MKSSIAIAFGMLLAANSPAFAQQEGHGQEGDHGKMGGHENMPDHDKMGHGKQKKKPDKKDGDTGKPHGKHPN